MQNLPITPLISTISTGASADQAADTDIAAASFTDAFAALQLDMSLPLFKLIEGFANGTSGTAVTGTDPNMMGKLTDLSKGGSGFSVAMTGQSSQSSN